MSDEGTQSMTPVVTESSPITRWPLPSACLQSTRGLGCAASADIKPTQDASFITIFRAVKRHANIVHNC